MQTEISKKISSQLPFKSDPTVIKSDWVNSTWSRKQIRIKVETSGELTIQSISQNAFARLASAILKFSSCIPFSSVGKKVKSYTFAGYTLPTNLAAPLSEQKRKNLLEIQCNQLGLLFLPSHKKLSDLATELIDFALLDPESCDQAVRSKIVDLCQEILDLQLQFTQEFQKDLSPEELYAKFQEFEKQAKTFCEEFPIILKTFIEKNNLAKEPPEELKPAIKKYSELLDFAKAHVVELKERLQFTSAEWLEKEIHTISEKISNEGKNFHSLKSAIESLEDALDCTEEETSYAAQLQALPVDSPSEQKLKGLVIGEIREILAKFSEDMEAKQNAFIKLLQGSEPSAWQQDLLRFFDSSKAKAKLLAESHDTFESSIPGFETGRHLLNPWIGNTNPLVELEALDRSSLIQHLSNVDDYCSSTLDFLEAETQTEKIFELIPQYKELDTRVVTKLAQLEKEGQYLHAAELGKIKKDSEQSLTALFSSLSSSTKCHRYAKTLEKSIEALNKKLTEIEKNPEIDSTEQLIGLKQLESPFYEPLRLKLISDSKTQLTAYMEVLERYQEILTAGIEVLKESNAELAESLLEFETVIQDKISEAQALTVDFATRLHIWQLFRSEVAVDDLPPQQLKDYLEKVSHLVLTGIEDTIQEAAYCGIKFD